MLATARPSCYLFLFMSRTCIVGELVAEQPVEDVVVPLETRLLVRHTRLLQQVCNTSVKILAHNCPR